MPVKIGAATYLPGMYGKKRSTGHQLADKYFRDLEKKIIGCRSTGNCGYCRKEHRL